MIESGTTEVDQFDYYTKARNHIFDVIIPEVTELCQQGKTAALIIILIERMAAGYHKPNAEVSVEHMEAFINGSRSDVRRARAWLIVNGYIELLGGGNGLDTSDLRIVLDPQERARVKESRNNPMLKDKPAKIISLPTESTCQTTENAAANSHGEEVPQTPDSDTVEPHHQAPDPEPDESALIPVTDRQTTDPTPDPTPETSSQISENENADKASEIKGGQSDHPSRASNGLVLIPGSKLEQTKSETELEEKKLAFGAVCSFAKSQNLEMEYRDYGFIQWAVEAYGEGFVLEKMEIAEMQKSRGVKFANPLGWFRDALTKDYQPTKFDGDVKKAREKARRAIERSQREQAERDSDREEWQTYRDRNPDAANKARAEFLEVLKNQRS